MIVASVVLRLVLFALQIMQSIQDLHCVSPFTFQLHISDDFVADKKFINYMVAQLTTAYNVRKMLPFIREDGNEHKKTTHTEHEEMNIKKRNETSHIEYYGLLKYHFHLFCILYLLQTNDRENKQFGKLLPFVCH